MQRIEPWPFWTLLGGALLVMGACASTARDRPGAAAWPTFPTSDEVAAAQDVIARKVAKLEARGPKAFGKPQQAMEFFVDQRLAEDEVSLPVARLRLEVDRLRERELVARSSAGTPAGGITTWTSIGPGNVGGRTRALVIDPNDPDTMFAGGVAGGIWKSVDGGASWNATDDLMLNLAISTIAMDPNDSQVLYAGTGEGFFQLSLFVQGLGIFKSTDGGETWNQLASTVNGTPADAFSYVNKIVVSPNNSNRIYAATRTGVWRSLDAGQSWTIKLGNPTYVASTPSANPSPEGCTDLVVRSDTQPDTLFAAFGTSQPGGLFRSQNNGNTWAAYTVGANQGRMTIALAPSDNDIMYLLMADNGLGAPIGKLVNVYRSDDGGDSFTAQVDFSSLTGPWLLSNLILATGCIAGGTYSQGWYDNIIAVDPMDPDIVWVGGVDIFRSDDGGQNFEIPGYWIFYTVSPSPPYYVHPDHHIIVFHPDYDGVANQTMYVGNDGGVFRTLNARAATSLEDCPLPGVQGLPEVAWESLNNGYGVTQFYHGDSARQDDMFIGGAQDNGTNRVLSRSTPDDWDLIFGGDGGYVAIDPRDSQVIFVEYQDFPSISKSVDGGETFVAASSGITDTDAIFIAPFTMDQALPDVLWTGGSRPWRTTDSAASWDVAGPDLPSADLITSIAVAPSDSNVVYLGFSNGFVARTTDALAPSPSWILISNGLVGGWISSVAVDPENPDVAYCSYSSYGVPHLFQTLDGGQSWTSIDGLAFDGVPDIPVHWIEVRPCDGRQLYAGSELGVFVSDDRGATWTPANTGLAHTVVESLDFKDDDTLVAFTYGRGAFLATLAPCPGRALRAHADPPMQHP